MRKFITILMAGARPAKHDLATPIFRQHYKRPRGERREDRPALGSVENARRAALAKPPNPREGFEEPDFLRRDCLDRRVDPVFGRADEDTVRLAELEHGRKFVQTRAEGFHPRLGDRQIDARREGQEAEAQDEKALLPATNAKEPERLQE
jgi:hypothetical protein